MEKSCTNCKHCLKSQADDPCFECVWQSKPYSKFEPKPEKKSKKHIDPEYGKIVITLEEVQDGEKGKGCSVCFDSNVKDADHKAKMFYGLACALEKHENEAWAKAMFVSVMKDMIDKEI